MATNKTLTPTNVTIAIPAMADKPDASVFSNCIDKEADAINTLNSKTTETFQYTGGSHALNGFVSKIGKIVFFGFFCDLNIPDNTVITTLPTGYRPNISMYPQQLFIPDARGQTKAFLMIDNNGKVTVKNPDNVTIWSFFTGMYFNE